MSEFAPVAVAPPPDATPLAAAAVEIAGIEAARDVELAEIRAETASEQIAADAETDDEVIEWLRNELAGLRASSETHAGELSNLASRLMEMETALASLSETVTIQAVMLAGLAPPVEEIPSPEMPPREEPTPKPPSEPEPGKPKDRTSENQADPPEQVPLPMARGRKRRWI